MARLFTEGFEGNDLLMAKSSSGTVSNAAVSRGGGTRSAQLGTTISTNPGSYILLSFPIAADMYIKCAFNTTYGTKAILQPRFDGTGPMTISRSSAGYLTINVGGVLKATGTTFVELSTWHIIECRFLIHPTSGIVDVRLNGLSEVYWTGNTQPGAVTVINELYLTQEANTQVTYYDDICINDTSGAYDNSWIGDTKIVALLPNANGDSSQWVNQGGNSTNNYLSVDEATSDSDTTYVQAVTSGYMDLYNYASMTAWSLGLAVRRVYPEAVAKLTSADGSSISLGIKSNGTEGWGSAIPLTATYKRIKGSEYLFDVSGGAAWTEARINAIQAGVKVV